MLNAPYLITLRFEMNRTEVLSIFHQIKVQKNIIFFTCILPNYVPHEITKEF